MRKARQNNKFGIVSDIPGHMSDKIKLVQKEIHFNSSWRLQPWLVYGKSIYNHIDQ